MISLRRQLLFDGASGIPLNRLVGMYLPALDADAKNLLAWSEAFDNAAWVIAGATVIVTANSTTAPDGSATADTLAPQAANSILHQAVPVAQNTVHTFSVYIKSTGADRVLDIVAYTPSFAVELARLAITATSVWQRFLFSFNSAANPIVWIAFGTAVHWSTGEDIYAWGAQLNVGSLLPYVPTTSKQVYLDRSGYLKHGQLGSTSGAEASDPAWMGDGLSYDGGDYVNLDAAGPVYNLTTGYTILMVVKGAAQATKGVYSEGTSGSANPFLFVGTGTTDTSKLRVAITDDAAASKLAVESVATALDSGWHLVGFRDNGGAYTLFIDGAKETGSYTQGTLTLNRATLGALGKNTYANFLTGSLIGPLRYTRPISNAEYDRIRRELRRMLASAPTPVVLP